MRTRHSLPESAVRAIAGDGVTRVILYRGRAARTGVCYLALMRRDPMERRQASDYPQELLTLFDRYVHGDIERRDFLDGAKKFAVGGLTAMSIWESLRPNYAWAQQVPKDDSRIEAEYETVPSPEGSGSIRGYLVEPAKAAGKLPGVLVVHENRGLNPYIEDVARRLGAANFLAFAPDGLTSVGGYPGDDEKGGAAFTKVDRAKMTEDFVAAAHWLKARKDCTGKIGVVGFCFGGGIANTLAVRMGSDLGAAVPFYGGQPPAAHVAKIKTPLLLHRSEEHTSELQSLRHLVCRLLLE